MASNAAERHLASKPVRREIELDFVRGIAILMVIDYHSGASPMRSVLLWLGFSDSLGWMGVDIFFVLSGFLVGGLLMKEWKVRRGIDAKRFLIRRGFKIWPLYYVFLGIMLITRHRSLNALWGNLLNIQNYVGGVAHTWSLAVEEHAYILLTLCLAVAARRKVSTRGLFWFLSAVCMAEIPVRYLMVYTGHAIFLPTHARLDSIGYGVLLAMLFHFAPDLFKRMSSWVWVWIACMVGGLLVLRISSHALWMLPLQHDAATLTAIGFFMFCYRPLRVGRTRHIWLYRAIAWVGVYSYGIYLWHGSVIAPIQGFAMQHPTLPAAAVSVVERAAEILVGFVATTAVEIPMLHLRDRLFPRRVDSAAGTPALMEVAEPLTAAL
jgi:peptidoglycan/LPS O-acetylase OafA/YrhL